MHAIMLSQKLTQTEAATRMDLKQPDLADCWMSCMVDSEVILLSASHRCLSALGDEVRLTVNRKMVPRIISPSTLCKLSLGVETHSRAKAQSQTTNRHLTRHEEFPPHGARVRQGSGAHSHRGPLHTMIIPKAYAYSCASV